MSAECANCAARFPVSARPAAFCSAACGAEAAAVRYGRRLRAEFGDDLPPRQRARLHRMVVHAVTECLPDKWSTQPVALLPAPVPDADDTIPDSDVFARRVSCLRARVLAEAVVRPCDAPDWDAVWRTWARRAAG